MLHKAAAANEKWQPIVPHIIHTGHKLPATRTVRTKKIKSMRQLYDPCYPQKEKNDTTRAFSLYLLDLALVHHRTLRTAISERTLPSDAHEVTKLTSREASSAGFSFL